MDPDKLAGRIVENARSVIADNNVEDARADTLAQDVLDLFEWLSRDGFHPDWSHLLREPRKYAEDTVQKKAMDLNVGDMVCSKGVHSFTILGWPDGAMSKWNSIMEDTGRVVHYVAVHCIDHGDRNGYRVWGANDPVDVAL